MKNLIIAFLLVVMTCSVLAQWFEVETNTELRTQIELLTTERDIYHTNLAACQGDLKP